MPHKEVGGMVDRASTRRNLLLCSKFCLSQFHIFANKNLAPSCHGFKERIRMFSEKSFLSDSSSFLSSTLLPPTIIYSDNHLLAINKPAGWHSVPNIPKKQKSDRHRNGGKYKNATTNQMMSSKKCLLTYLQRNGLGGGSKKDFLVPIHRIDQPCTGVLLFAKTSKAASRVTKAWRKGIGRKKNSDQRKNDNHSPRGIIKDYFCVVPTSRLGAMEEASTSINEFEYDETCDSGFSRSVRYPLMDGSQWKQLDGLMLRKSSSSEYSSKGFHRRQHEQSHNVRFAKGWSVKIVKRHLQGDSEYDSFYDYNHETDNATMRPVRVKWRIVRVPKIEPEYTLVLVRTSEGARHMVRGLLAQIGDCPILGDIRYWKEDFNNADKSNGMSGNKKGPLKDQSVALHAYGLYINKNHLQLGSLDTFEFRAPVPSTWKLFFGIDNQQLQDFL